MEAVTVNLPGGLRVSGDWHRDAVLRPLAGRDEAFLLQQGRELSVAARTTALLARCLSRVGSLPAVTTETVRSLTIGDREALLLHLRRLTFGETVSCVLACPHCAGQLDLDLQIPELLLPPYGHASDRHEASVMVGDIPYRVSFRLPNGADQEEAANLAATAPDAAVALVLRRCVQEITDGRTGEPTGDFPTEFADTVANAMSERDPQAEILLDLTCPSCQTAFRTTFDIGQHFYRELHRHEHDLYREVHLLAFHYRWSEAAILRLTRRTRLLYVALLSEALREGGLQ
jgi:hypothetical protein